MTFLKSLRHFSEEEEYLWVLCRLPLGVLNRQLGAMFGVSEASGCKFVTTRVCLLARIFDGILLRWPTSEGVKQHTRVIIDATEFFVEKPTSACAKKATCFIDHNFTLLDMGKMHHGLHRYFLKSWYHHSCPFRIPSLIFLLVEPDTFPR